MNMVINVPSLNFNRKDFDTTAFQKNPRLFHHHHHNNNIIINNDDDDKNFLYRFSLGGKKE